MIKSKIKIYWLDTTKTKNPKKPTPNHYQTQFQQSLHLHVHTKLIAFQEMLQKLLISITMSMRRYIYF